jgi:hypothetical protein
MEAILTLKLTGTRPMLMHNGRLSNPLDPHTRGIAAIAKKTNKTDKDHAELASLEARGSMYETDAGLLGMPNINVWRCIYNAAKAFKLGEDIKRALIATLDVTPILIKGKTELCDTYIGDASRILYVPVVIKKNRTMRARPIIPIGWETTVSFALLTDVLQPERLTPVIERAGRLVGLGDWRPIYGTFRSEVVAG